MNFEGPNKAESLPNRISPENEVIANDPVLRDLANALVAAKDSGDTAMVESLSRQIQEGLEAKRGTS